MKRSLLPIAAVLMFLPIPALRAQQAAPPADQPARLDAALAQLPKEYFGDDKVIVAIDPWMTPHHPTALASQDQTTAGAEDSDLDPLDAIARTYGRSIGTFDTLTAVAPATMQVLNTDSSAGDIPLSVLAGRNPLPFLLATLTPYQFQLLGSTGLGMADLTPDQQSLLKAALPHPFQIVPRDAIVPTWVPDEDKPGSVGDAARAQASSLSKAYWAQAQPILDNDLYKSVRLHANLTAFYSLSDVGFNLAKDEMPPLGPYKLTMSEQNEDDSAGTVSTPLESLLAAPGPNVLKPSDLDWNRPELQVKIPLTGLNTVGGVVDAVASATHLELHVSPYYRNRRIAFYGNTDQPQTASDLLQALCLCACATWRQVGPCWVLTDDVQGLGARYAILNEIVQRWSNRLSDADKDVGSHLADLDWARQLTFLDQDPTALPHFVLERIAANPHHADYVPWTDVSDRTKDAIKQDIAKLAGQDSMKDFVSLAQSNLNAEEAGGKAWVSLDILFSWELTEAPGVPSTGLMPFGQQPYSPREDAPATDKPAPPAKLDKIVLTEPLRGVFCGARTSAEAVAIVDRLASMGMNTLFLDAFWNGRAYFPNDAIAPESTDAAGVLAAAIREGQMRGVAVYAVADVLCWRKDGGLAHPKPWPSVASQDLTILGEPADVGVRRRIEKQTIRGDLDLDGMKLKEANESWASPGDDAVRSRLPKLLRALSSTSGLAGIVVEDVAGPGYYGAENRVDPELDLGYTPANRLAYLRKYDVDPIDITRGEQLQIFLPNEGNQVQLPVDFPMGGNQSDARPWDDFRTAEAKSLMPDYFAAIQSAAPAVPLYMREIQYGETFDPWVDPAKPNLYVESGLQNKWDYVTSGSILDVPYSAEDRARPWEIVRNTNFFRDHFGHGIAGGIVYDFVNESAGEPPLRILDTIAPYFSKPGEASKGQ